MHNVYFSRYSNSFEGNCLVSHKYFVENVSSPPEAPESDRSRWIFLLMARRAQWARLGVARSRGRLTLSPGQGAASALSSDASSVT